MNLDKQLEKIIADVPKAVAAGIVDMESAMLLGIKSTGSHPSEVFDFLSAATHDLFEGDNVITIEKIFKKTRGVTSNDHYFQEMLIMSNNLIHYMARCKTPTMILGVVCSKDANIGLVLAKSRQFARELTL
jgi:hypothetical protein